MDLSNLETKRLPIKLGFWSSFLSVILFLVFIVCFVVAFTIPPVFYWTNLADYVSYSNTSSQPFKYVAQMAMLIFAPLYVVLLNSIHDLTSGDKKILARISLCFGALFALLISMHYFMQVSIVRLDLIKGQIDGLEQFVQANPYAAISAINMLGWTLFFGLSSLFIVPVFSGNGLEKVIKITFLVNGIACILGGIGFGLDIVPLVFWSIDMVMGGAVTAFTICLSILFWRLGKRSSPFDGR